MSGVLIVLFVYLAVSIKQMKLVWLLLFALAANFGNSFFLSPRNIKLPSLASTSLETEFLRKEIELASQRFQNLSSWINQAAFKQAALSSSDFNRNDALKIAYDRCEQVTKTFSKTFYTGSMLMRPDARKHVWAIYAWCRRTDDLVDAPRPLASTESLTTELKDWEDRLDGIWRGEAVDLIDLAMVDSVQKFPLMSVQPYKDMILGMLMDVPGLGKDRYASFDELYLYCYRVAGTVGLMTLPILGTSPGVSIDEASHPAISLGIGFQLTNILRDVGEDLERGRIYLPQDELQAFGLCDDDLYRAEVSPQYVEFIKFQIDRARKFYKKAEEGLKTLAPDARFAIQASLDLYSQILSVVERNGYDNFRRRAYTTKMEKLAMLPGAMFKSR